MKKIIIKAMAITLACCSPAMAGAFTDNTEVATPRKMEAMDVALQVATLLGNNISVTDNGEPVDANMASAFVGKARENRSDADSWNIRFAQAGCYDAEISCYKRNDARYFVVHTISKKFSDGKYELHSVKYYIFDGRKLMPVKDLPCNSPVSDADFSDDLGKHNFLNADQSTFRDDSQWTPYLASSNREYQTVNERTLRISVHNATASHRTVDLVWNNDKFSKRLGNMQIIHAKDFAGIFLGDEFPNGIDLGNVKVAMINESVYKLMQGSIEIARIDLKRGVVSCVIISAPGYSTGNGYSIGEKIDVQAAHFVARQGNDIYIDDSGIQYRIDGNNVCREITIKNQ